MPRTERRFGWVPHPAETESFISSIPKQTTDQVDGLVAFIREGRDCLLWEPLVALLGHNPKTHRLAARNQGDRGFCVGVSDAGAQDILAAADVIERKEPESWEGLHSGIFAYVASREAGGILHERFDGSFGSAMAKAVQDIGTLIQGSYGSYDFSSYDTELADRLDVRGGGVPGEVKAVSLKHRIHNAALVENLDQLDALLYQFYPVNICSTFGSRDRQRDQNGCLRWNGEWPHSMHVVGIVWRKVNGRFTRIYIVRNSWGSRWMSQGPLVVDNMPLGSFGMYEQDMARVLKQRDTFVRSGYDGFKKRDIDLDYMLDF